jgi:L-fucose isomerase-like protein
MKQSCIMIANGDLRLPANQGTWSTQLRAEQAVVRAAASFGADVKRGFDVDSTEGHGFIKSQKHGMEVFRQIPRDAPLIVVETVWQYSQHILSGLLSHRGPILTVANWSGEWPGLVGLLNLNACLSKLGVPFSTLWSETFEDDWFLSNLKQWLDGIPVIHDTSHVKSLSEFKLACDAERIADGVVSNLLENKAILGVFDEGCMGMYNAMIPDELLSPIGIFKERLSQSALYYAMTQISDEEAGHVRGWLDRKGVQFRIGPNPESDLTDNQVLEQCKMYIAALRIADDFGCDAIGIQYQQGLKDLVPASDLVEGLLNNCDRPPVQSKVTGLTLFEGRALPHFNEVDECAGVDALLTNRIWTGLGLDPETTLHDIRYGEDFEVDGRTEFVWTFEISGAVPPQHLTDGYKGVECVRQPTMTFRMGGATIKGISKPGAVVWSRIFVEDNCLKADIGRAKAVALPREESERRWQLTNWQWPMMHAVLFGITRDQMMARHKANHIQVAYAPDSRFANRALAVKAAAFARLGIEVNICGTGHGLEPKVAAPSEVEIAVGVAQQGIE